MSICLQQMTDMQNIGEVNGNAGRYEWSFSSSNHEKKVITQ